MNTFYHSTRTAGDLVTSKQAIMRGIAPDGGLYVSDALSETHIALEQACEPTYHEIATHVLQALLPDFTSEEVSACVSAAYGNNFSSPAVTPLTPLGPDWLLELYHGPTCAFKDVALQMLPQLMSVARRSADNASNVMIVTATSGDTGKAALAGFADVPGTGVTVFYPAGKVSDIQRLQMVTQAGANVAVAGIEGTFDDAQTQVKAIFADAALNDALAAKGTVLSSANSINVGRLVPQVAYYFSAYAQLVAHGALTVGDPVEFVVPTGNFGDVLAGYYAKEMGLPVSRLVVASNTNKVLTDFIETGTYDRRRDFVKTISPSMDILVSSNLERLLYYASGRDVELISSLMESLATQGFYTVPTQVHETIASTFAAGWATDDETRAAIARSWEEQHVLIDPHTAVGVHVMGSMPAGEAPRVCLSTANAYKFSADVLAALGADVTGMDGFACMDELARRTGTEPPAQLAALSTAPELHGSTVAQNAMPAFVTSACARIFA